MGNSIKWRVSLIIVFTLLSIVFLTPTLLGTLPGWWKGVLPQEKLRLGLDLQGGMHLVLAVETEKAIENTLDRYAGDIKDALKKKDMPFIAVERSGSRGVSVKVPTSQSADSALKLLKDDFPYLDASSPIGSEGNIEITAGITKKEVGAIEDFAVRQGVETLRNRIDQFGVSEPVIIRQGKYDIVVQLPGVKDPKRALELIGKTALLEFKLVDEGASVDEALKGNIPEGSEILYEKNVDKETGRVSTTPLVIKKRAVLTGDVISDARVAIDSQFNKPYVSITFDSRGSRMFDQLTAENVKKRMAIVLDGTVYSAPVIQERISGGRAQISGTYSMDEATDLAIALRAGALPAPVKILQNLTVGPTLGQDSIEKGIKAALLGAILVVIFMVVYYRFSGVIADLALLLNILFLMGALAVLGATLTLPGIAGIILTIGMAVDSNVLILERIREELKLGKTVRSAIDGGYDKAFLTIMDSHVTTLITAVVLFQFGTGPIKGFAVSLSLGVLINLFTAIIGTKVVYDYLIKKGSLKTLKL
ncbi:MAG TPA: protein translocase subunit SecD [Nitrospiraceae bacterium]|nr:protein translocase subunit SecD [Nitrospiraceae bacterium]